MAASQFVYSQHGKSCRGLGMEEDKIAAIHAWEVADCFDASERALRSEFDDRDDPIVEVDAPEGFDAAAFADDILLEFAAWTREMGRPDDITVAPVDAFGVRE